VQAGTGGIHPKPATTGAASCAKEFLVGFVADVAGLDSRADAAAWQGVREALRRHPCAHADFTVPTRPSEYLHLLQAYADRRVDLVVAASFLLTDAVVDAARTNPATHFLLVDPIAAPVGSSNLAVLTFRDDQAAYLAGALAGMVTKTGLIAGIYGPGGAPDQRDRSGFEHGALYVRPAVRVMGAYQPAADGLPYANPGWGAAQARAFVHQGADVIFGTGGTTGQGALRGAAQAGSICIGGDAEPSTDPRASGCLLASSMKFVDRGVALIVVDAAAGHWVGGLRQVGLAEGAVELGSLQPEVLPGQLEQLRTIAGLLAAGKLTTGA